MVEHAGVGCALSLAIVAGFAILLHEQPVVPPAAVASTRPGPVEAPPEPPARVAFDAGPPPEGPTRPAPAPEPVRPAIVVQRPAPPPRATPAAAPAKRAAVALIETSSVAVLTRPAAVPAPAPAPAPAPVARRAEPERPRVPASSFAEVLAGETLAELALRVYGTARVAEALWRANRDQAIDRSGPLVAGTWLRTPPCGDD